MAENTKTRYTPEQLQDAERMAKLLKTVPKEKEDLLATMASVFISGMETGMQLSEKSA